MLSNRNRTRAMNVSYVGHFKFSSHIKKVKIDTFFNQNFIIQLYYPLCLVLHTLTLSG